MSKITITPYSYYDVQNQKKKIVTIPSAGKDVEQVAFSYITSGNEKCHSQTRKQFGSFF
jgi:hypothetical protein